MIEWLNLANPESGEPSIRNIIETHNQLVLSYKQMMTLIQKQGFLFCFETTSENEIM